MIIKIEYENSKHIYRIPIELLIKELNLEKETVEKAVVKLISRG